MDCYLARFWSCCLSLYSYFFFWMSFVWFFFLITLCFLLLIALSFLGSGHFLLYFLRSYLYNFFSYFVESFISLRLIFCMIYLSSIKTFGVSRIRFFSSGFLLLRILTMNFSARSFTPLGSGIWSLSLISRFSLFLSKFISLLFGESYELAFWKITFKLWQIEWMAASPVGLFHWFGCRIDSNYLLIS